MTSLIFGDVAKDKPAVIMAGSREVLTYGEMRDGAFRLAQWFRSRGLQVGDHVAFCIENHPMFLVVAWGAYAAGLVYTPISNRSSREDAAYIIHDCGAKAFITTEAMAGLAADLVGPLAHVPDLLMLDGVIDHYESYEKAVATMPPEPLPEGVAGRDMLYSSGTTGRPKGVMVDFPDRLLGEPMLVTTLAADAYGFGPETLYLCPAPLYHAAPLRFATAVHQLGGTTVVMEKFDPVLALELIERHGVTASQWVPTMFVRMLKLDAAERSRFDLSSHMVALHAAAPCPIPVKEKMLGWWGPIIHEYYSGTEGNGSTRIGPEEWLTHKGSVGRPFGCTVHIVGDDGEELRPGAEGLVYFDGRSFAYHNDPTKTADARHARGWTTLGDIGRLDEDGYLYLTDRKANTIISGGVNLYPQEIENLLIVHPRVADVAVIGVPSEEFGEEVKAVVQLADPAEASPELAAELIAYCKDRLAGPKVPKSVDFEAELPRHPTGKLHKRVLRDRYWQGKSSRLV